jgi:hypothetical protein
MQQRYTNQGNCTTTSHPILFPLFWENIQINSNFTHLNKHAPVGAAYAVQCLGSFFPRGRYPGFDVARNFYCLLHVLLRDPNEVTAVVLDPPPLGRPLVLGALAQVRDTAIVELACGVQVFVHVLGS